MKTLSTLLATAILTFSASVSAGTSSELSQEQAIDSLVKKLTMSCYRNREGDRLFVGAVETVRFCQNAASQEWRQHNTYVFCTEQSILTSNLNVKSKFHENRNRYRGHSASPAGASAASSV